MKKKLMAVWTCIFLSFTLISQNREKLADTIQIDEVVVTHSKIPTSRRHNSKPIQVIDKKLIEESAGKDLAQVLQEQSAVLVNGAYSNPGKDKSLYLQGASNEYTLILLDGQPITDPSGLGGSFDLRLIPLQSLERIEILPGSQSTLYGSDAIAGVINLISKKPSAEKRSVSGHLAYGSFNTLTAGGNLSGHSNRMDYNLNVNSLSTSGFSEAAGKNPADDFDNDGSKQLGVQVNLGISVTDEIKFKPYLRYSDFESDFDDGAFADAGNRFDGQVLQSGFETRFQSKKSHGFLNYGISKTERTFQTTFGNYHYDGRFQNFDVLYSYKLSGEFQLVTNANLQESKMMDSTATEPDPSVRIASPSVLLLWKPNEKLNLESGFRYNNHSRYGSNSNASVSGSYRPAENLKVFTSISSGFKAPSLNQLYGAFGANPELRPQTSLHLDAGLEWTNRPGQIGGQISFFRRVIEDVIVYDFATGYRNQNRQNDHGINMQVNMKLSEKLFFAGSYSYLNGEVETPLSGGQDTTFHNLFRRPKHGFTANLRYSPNDKTLLTLSGQYNGKRNDLYFNPANFFAEESVTLDPYLLVNVYFSYKLRSGKIILFADVKNLFNADFSEVYGFNTAGFNLMAGVQFKF